MTMTITSPITGTAQTGLTAPTYTHVADIAPDSNGRQVAVTAVGGTQTGVNVHSVAAPFTITVVRPKVLKGLGKANPVTGVVRDVPKNVYKIILRKGVLPLAGQPYQVMLATINMEVPAGSDLADAPNIRAGLSALFGAASQISAGTGDTCTSGVM
jgi:hypothetical protein